MALNRPYQSLADLPSVLPLFPLADCILLPQMQLPLNIFEPRYLAMVDDAMRDGHRLIGMIQPKDGVSAMGTPPLERVGCAGRITEIAETGDGRYRLTLTGICRFTIAEELVTTTPYRQAAISYADFVADMGKQAVEPLVDRQSFLRILQRFLALQDLQFDAGAMNAAPLADLVDTLAMVVPWGAGERQALLETKNTEIRADLMLAIAQKALMAKGNRSPLQ